MSKSLIEAGLKLASSKSSKSNRGFIFLDRTIFYTVEVKDSQNKVICDSNGNPIVENRAYLTKGRWIPESLMEKALEIEKEFIELNNLLRKDEESKDMRWRMSKSELTAISIPGLT